MTENEMRHISTEVMRGYARGTLGEAERARVDDEMLVCDRCLALFMSMLGDEADAGGPGSEMQPMPDLSAMEEKVIAQLAGSSERQVKVPVPMPKSAAMKPVEPRRRSMERRPTLMQRPVVQYTIAASVTLLLLASGALADFTRGLEKLDESQLAMPAQPDAENAWRVEPTWSDELVQRTGSWLEGIQASRFK
jgi:hypothetical protein